MLVAKIHGLLDGPHIIVILVCRVVAQNVHVEAGTFLDHRQADAASADDCDRLAGDLVSEKRKIRVPGPPFLLAHQFLAAPHLAS